ncbi:aldo/keto reductase [Sphingobacterium oryzagri]|uniref:Aldo/keto reductase n=1 Tax=Sphingobacterium oryzagri TaxID=3025669 RepID=A0ABY7WC87_9SPHI|nr:aldo/keto reductase [Sphingobacterium sp. KACC 22765]WDF67070.1 aldo/keto reductase [Sphingobacterium sp. KACC 22765]
MKKTITIADRSDHPLRVSRLGYGTMRLPGEQVWGEPKDRNEAIKILQTAVESGVNFFDTADFYGEDITNKLIVEALYPYREDVVICTKVGASRKPDKSWIVFDKPENLRESIDRNLKTLNIEQIQLVHFRIMPHSTTPLEESLEAMYEMQKEGKIKHIGLSNVSPTGLKKGLEMGSIVSVENAFGYGQRSSFESHGQQVNELQEVIQLCIDNHITMIPFWSLQNSLSEKEDKIGVIAKKYGASRSQINIAWLLHFNQSMLPIPGTSNLTHLTENISALGIRLTDEDMLFLG